jgi:DNA sulfur modification protein DndC
LEKCFETSSRSQEEAIENAHKKRDLKTAAGEGNVEKIKELTWASLKFSTNGND